MNIRLITSIHYDGHTLTVKGVAPGVTHEVSLDFSGDQHLHKRPAWVEWTEIYNNASMKQYKAWSQKMDSQ